MRTSYRRTFLAGLILTAALGAGCNMMAAPYFLLMGMDSKHEAKCKLASEDKDKEVRVVILASCSQFEMRPEFLRIDRELSQLSLQVEGRSDDQR